MNWNPELYLRFADHRLRPALDLIAHIDLAAPEAIYDLGCGTGNVSLWLRQRWPSARIFGIDSSPEMLAQAAETMPDLIRQQCEIVDWRPERPAPLIYSNAALQWLDDHPRLFPALYGCLAPGGVLAVQMPRNFAQPSHLALAKTVANGPWQNSLTDQLRRAPVAAPLDYFRLLQPLGAILDLWETDYLQRLTGEEAVFQWMMGTTLRPLLRQVDPGLRERFLADLRERLLVAYPPEEDGSTLFPFRRLFLVARRPH